LPPPASPFSPSLLATTRRASRPIRPSPPNTALASADTATTEDNIRKAQDFVTAAGQAGIVEIRTSRMALEKSSNPDVKAFAQMMIDQHTAANEALAAAATSAALIPPSDTLDDFHMRRINDLTETDGDADFDADYMHLQVDAHNDAIKLFEAYSSDGQIAQVKDFAIATLPTLTEHKVQAEKINDMVKSTTPAPS
jgi:putative membrane protein